MLFPFLDEKRLLTITFVVHLVAAWFSVGHYHADEYHQILQFAAFYLGTVAETDLAWEYEPQIRSAFQPFVAVGVVKILSAFGAESPFIAAFVLRVLSAALAIFASILFFRAFADELTEEKSRRWVLIVMLLLWTLVFYHVRFSSEGWMGSFLLIALAAHRLATKKSFSISWGVVAGMSLGFMFLSRYQSGIIIFSLLLYIIFINRESWRQIAVYSGGAIVVLILGIFLDWHFYNEVVIPWIKYIQFHITSGSPNEMQPRYTYFLQAMAALPPISFVVPFVIVAFYIIFRRHVFTWATALFFIFHISIENQQTRFLMPLIPFIPFMFAMLWQKYQRQNIRSYALRILHISVIVNIPLLVFVMFYPPAKEVKILQDCIVPQTQNKSSRVYVMGGKRAVYQLDLDFYNVSHINFVPIDSNKDIIKINEDEEVVLFAARKNRDKPPLNARLICQAIPDWIRAININNWTSRASFWRVWKVSD